MDRDGVLNRSEVTQLIESLKLLAVEQYPNDGNDAVVSLEVSDLINGDVESIHLESFLMWAVQRKTLKHLLDMLHQVRSTLIELCNFVFCFSCSLLLIYSSATSFWACALHRGSKKVTLYRIGWGEKSNEAIVLAIFGISYPVPGGNNGWIT